jgi:peptidoglycan/xylan/chitin deacetylase (PgdA/CDA1 family)
VEQQFLHLLQPTLLPGAEEQKRGQLAFAAGDLSSALRHFSSAFAADAGLPGLREELMAVNHALGLPSPHVPARIDSLRQDLTAVALTFDDGPHPKITPWILDQLDRVDARATFFVVAKQVEMYPDLAREIVARGHEIASHTYNHENLAELSREEIERELIVSRALIFETTGELSPLFRPPGGQYDATVASVAREWGFSPVFWTANICDFYYNPEDRVVEGLCQDITPGGIVLLHNGEDMTTQILPALLQKLQRDGYAMRAVSDLVRPTASPAPPPYLRTYDPR